MTKVRSRIQKGRNFQKRVMELIKEAFDLSEDEIRTPVGCETGVDIKLSSTGREKVGLSIECKNQKSLSIWASLEQAKANTCDGCEPALIFHRSVLGNRDTWIAVPLHHYLDLRRK
jgi:hypothetical protein